jgi:hypothetical protein
LDDWISRCVASGTSGNHNTRQIRSLLPYSGSTSDPGRSYGFTTSDGAGLLVFVGLGLISKLSGGCGSGVGDDDDDEGSLLRSSDGSSRSYACRRNFDAPDLVWEHSISANTFVTGVTIVLV